MKVKKILPVISLMILVATIVGILIFIISSSRVQKLSCASSVGDITISYDDQGITGYTASTTINYDFSRQQDYAKDISIESYLDEFTGWFEANTGGVCHR